MTLGDEYSWFDAGTADSLYDAAGEIRKAQRSGKMIGCIEEVALKKRWITIDNLLEQAKSLEKTQYGQYLYGIAAEQEDAE